MQFDNIIDRRGSGSVKWDEANEGVLPMWVADMDFTTAPCIIEALKRRVEHGVFGYTFVTDEYYEALTNWFERRHGWKIDRSSVIYVPGVVPAISAILRGVTVPGDGVLLQSPVYNCFYSSIRNLGCRLVDAPLIYNPGPNPGYTMDYDAFERLAAEPWVKVFILCNPHNPVGRVWKRGELERIGRICLDNNVLVISDEIHCELTYNGIEYTPYQSLGDDFARNSVACLSPSKAFNTAGLQIANIICPDKEIYRKVDRGVNINEVCDVNPFGVAGLIAAYNQGGQWLDDLRNYLWENYLLVKDFMEQHLASFPIQPLEGTYLVWIDCSVTGMSSDDLCSLLKTEGKVWLSPGSMYGAGGEGFIRLNIACPRERLREGLERMKYVLEKFCQS